MKLKADQEYIYYLAYPSNSVWANDFLYRKDLGYIIYRDWSQYDMVIPDPETNYLTNCPAGTLELDEPEKQYTTLEAVKLVMEERREFYPIELNRKASKDYICKSENGSVAWDRGGILVMTAYQFKRKWVEKKG
jgi:hypothetical protein